jgi:hypothetical protein
MPGNSGMCCPNLDPGDNCGGGPVLP